MKATEIVEKLKDVLLGAEKEIEAAPEVQEEVQLSEEVTNEEVSTEEVELNEETPAVEEIAEDLNEDIYATKQELAEVKAMVEKMMGMMDSKEEKMEVPKEELSAVEESVEPMVHSPENEAEKTLKYSFGQNRPQTTLDRVMARINK